MKFVADNQPAEPVQPGEQPLHHPAAKAAQIHGWSGNSRKNCEATFPASLIFLAIGFWLQFGSKTRCLSAVFEASSRVSPKESQRVSLVLLAHNSKAVVQIHPPQPKLLLFLTPTSTPVRAVPCPILLIGSLSGVWVYFCHAPRAFVLRDLLFSIVDSTFGDCAQRC